MQTPRRTGSRGSDTRTLLIDAAERLMLEEGYASVTSRKLGARAGLTPQLVHYYFTSMDDLFLAVFRRRADEGVERLARAAGSIHSLRAIWELQNDSTSAAFNLEFSALANHRKAVRAEIVRYAERYRTMQLELVSDLLAARDDWLKDCPPSLVLLMLVGFGQNIHVEKGLGITAGHQEAVSFLTEFLNGPDSVTAGRRQTTTPPKAPARHPRVRAAEAAKRRPR